MRRDGRWEGRIAKGKNRNGTRQFQYFFGKTREETQKKMTEIRRKSQNGCCFLSITQLFNEWMRSIKHQVKESTAANYFLKAQKHILPVFGKMQVEALESADVYSFIELKQQSGLSNSITGSCEKISVNSTTVIKNDIVERIEKQPLNFFTVYNKYRNLSRVLRKNLCKFNNSDKKRSFGCCFQKIYKRKRIHEHLLCVSFSISFLINHLSKFVGFF